MKPLVGASELLASDWPMKFAMAPNGEDEPFGGSCPCGLIHGDGFEVEVHCWRASCEHGCKYSGIHVSGTIDESTKRKIAEHIRDNNRWTTATEWALVIVSTSTGSTGQEKSRREC